MIQKNYAKDKRFSDKRNLFSRVEVVHSKLQSVSIKQLYNSFFFYCDILNNQGIANKCYLNW